MFWFVKFIWLIIKELLGKILNFFLEGMGWLLFGFDVYVMWGVGWFFVL